MRLTAKLSLLFLLLSLVPITVVGYLAYDHGRRAIEHQTLNYLKSTNLLKESQFDYWVRDKAVSLEIITKNPYFRDHFRLDMTRAIPVDSEQAKIRRTMVEDHLVPFLEGEGLFELFIMRVDDGLVLISTDEKAEGKYRKEHPYFVQGKARTYIQNVYYSMALQQAAMTVSAPLKDRAGRLQAVLAGRVDLAPLSQIMEQGRELSRSLDTFLVNKFNFFVTEPRFGRGYALKKSVQTEGVKAALTHREGVGFYKDYRGVPVIGAYRWMAQWEMGLITEIDQEEAFAPIEELKRKIIGIGFLVALLAAAAGWFSARTITRPIRRLTAGAEEIGQGNLEFRVGTEVKDEIGQLSRVLERMAENLKKTTVSRDVLLEEVEKRRLAEDALRATSARQEALLSALPDIIMEVDSNKVYTWANQPGLEFFGQEVVGKEAALYFEGEQDTYQSVKPLFDGDEKILYVLSWQRRKDGQKRLLAWWCRVLKDEAGNVTGALSTARDITEHQRAEETILRERDFTQAAIDSLPGLFYLFDDQGRFLRWNKNFEKVSGYSAEEISHLSPLDLFDAPDKGPVGKSIQQVFLNGEASSKPISCPKTKPRPPVSLRGSFFSMTKSPA